MKPQAKRQPLIGVLAYGVGRLLRLAWNWRIELALALSFGAVALAASAAPLWVSGVATLLLSALFWFSYDRIGRALLNAKVRRQLERAADDAGFPGLRVERVAPTLPGDVVRVQVPRGRSVEKLAAIEREMRAGLRVSDVRVVPDVMDRSRADVSIIRRDPFQQMTAMDWPLLEAKAVDLRQPFDFGLDEYGRTEKVKLLSRNMIMGGAPDAGKSSALRLVAAAAALDPRAKLWMMDAKTGGAEFVHWAPACEMLVRGRDLESAVELLAKLEERVEARGREIVAQGEVFVTDDMEIDVLMIDELPQFTRTFESDSKTDAAAVKSIKEGIWRLIALGRWTGMITVLSAQKPTADIVPSESRDLIDLKFALHCNTRQMSDAILGDGSGGETPVSAVEIPEGQPGVGYLLSGGSARKIRTFYMTHKQAMGVASRASSRKIDDELRAMA